MASRVGAVVAGELDEVDLVGDRDGTREVGQEDEAGLQQRQEQQLALGVVPCDLSAQLLDASPQLLGGEEDLADAGVGGYGVACDADLRTGELCSYVRRKRPVDGIGRINVL